MIDIYYIFEKENTDKLCKNLFMLLAKQTIAINKIFVYIKHKNKISKDLQIILSHKKIVICKELDKKISNKIIIKDDIDINTDYIKNRYNIINFKEKNKIIGALTSWEKRIGNCYDIIYNMLYNQTVFMDKLYLTLSTDEFKNKEADLPADIVNLAEIENRFEINWVKENTKCMKAVFPILDKINDNDVILKMDDDILYPADYIENRVNDYIKSKLPISADRYNKWELVACGPSMLYTKYMLKNYNNFINDEIIKGNNEDSTIAAILYLNGYKLKIAEKYNIVHDFTHKYVFNPIEASGERNDYIMDIASLRKMLFGRITTITNKSFENSFGFWKKIN